MDPSDPEGRTRHVAFRIEADEPVGREALVQAVQAVAADLLGRDGLEAMHPWLTVFDGEEGLLRVRHTHQEEAREVLEAIRWVGDPDETVTVVPLGTSGTIRAARERHLTG